MARYKVCFFVPFYPLITGGAEYQGRILSKALEKDKDFDIFYISGGHSEKGLIEFEGTRVYTLPIPIGLLEKLRLYRSYMKEVAEILRQERPAIIYQRILNTFTYRMSEYSATTQTPLIIHIADNYCLEFSFGIKEFLRKALLKRILSRSPYIICQTEYQAKQLRILNFNPELTLPNMHPKIEIGKTAKDLNKVLWIGNARPVKQLELYLDLANNCHDIPREYHIIGKIPDNEYGSSLKSEINRLDNVIYHGPKENTFINQFLQEVGLLVNTSRSEGFPNTFIQSWLCGTPVVSLSSDPLCLIEKHGIGYNCNNNHNLLSHGIDEVLYSSNYEDICFRAINLSVKYFSLEENLPRFKQLIKKILNGKK